MTREETDVRAHLEAHRTYLRDYALEDHYRRWRRWYDGHDERKPMLVTSEPTALGMEEIARRVLGIPEVPGCGLPEPPRECDACTAVECEGERKVNADDKNGGD
jgi:hypothetical protein